MANMIKSGGAKLLIEQLVQLGYLHGRQSQTDQDGDDLPTYRKLLKDPTQNFFFDVNCDIIRSEESSYYSRNGWIRSVVALLDKNGGRQSRKSLCSALKVDEIFLADDSPLLQKLPSSVQVVGLDLISDSYWQTLREKAEKQVHESGSLQILELANNHHVPMELIVQKVVSSINETRLVEDSKVLVSDAYIHHLQFSVVSHFKSLVEPVLVAKVCESRAWDTKLVLDWLIHETENKNILGEVHVDTGRKNASTAMFLPEAYNDKQKQEVLQFLSVNGFITQKRATQHGLSLSKVAQLAGKSAITIDDILIIEHIVLQKIELAIQVCTETGIVDIQDYLPTELIRSDVLPDLLRRADFTSEEGQLIIVEGQALIISKALSEAISNKVLSPMIQVFSKTRAAELFAAGPGVEEDDEEDLQEVSGRKGKSKSRRKTKSKRSTQRVEVTVGFVSLVEVAKAIINEYPNSPLTDFNQEGLSDYADGLTWEDDEDFGIPLVQFCKTLYSLESRDMFEKSVYAELQSLQSAKKSKASLSRRDEAAKVRSIEAAFEDVFVSLCFMLQANAKFLALAESSKLFDENSLEIVRKEMLQCYCADLTSRITQYCLFKNEEESIFTFAHPDEKESLVTDEPSGLPSFCSSLSFAQLRYPKAYLSCPPPREPLPVLRESLPGNIGVTLARLWVSCGGESFRGGCRTSEDGSKYIRPGSVDSFLTHAQENCLSLCGFPFKKLDKKSEKQFLFRRRRQALTEMLQVATDPKIILELTIVILFQQVKQTVVSGVLLRGAILECLLVERKISSAVGDALNGLNSAVDADIPVNENLVKAVKECGLCRDISKHEVSGLSA